MRISPVMLLIVGVWLARYPTVIAGVLAWRSMLERAWVARARG